MSNTNEGVHVCEYLAYKDSSIRLVYPENTESQRERLQLGFSPIQRWCLFKRDEVELQVVMFCPYCGEDFRRDLLWQIPGRPQENEIWRNAYLAGKGTPEGKSTYSIQTNSLLGGITSALRQLSEQFKEDPEMTSVGKLKVKCLNGLKIILEWSNPGPKWNQPKPALPSKKSPIVRIIKAK